MLHPSLVTFSGQTKIALDHLHAEFGKLQTGRANASLIEHISIEAYGQKMELKGVASISVQDARSIVIQPWDKAALASIEKGIMAANIGVTPVNDGIVVRLNFPPMTEERRTQITKIVGQLAEQCKIRVRQDRQTEKDALKDIADKDAKERAQKELQKLVDDANAKIDESAKKKVAEVLSV
jgi:ribosome recycling factor